MDNLKIANCFQLNTDTMLNKRKITEKLPVERPVTPVLKNDTKEELSLMKRKVLSDHQMYSVSRMFVICG